MSESLIEESQSRPWHVCRCTSRREKTASDYLASLGYEAYLPVDRIQVRIHGKFRKIDVPIFPSYLFMRMTPARDQWMVEEGWRGIRGLMCTRSGRPVDLGGDVISAIKEGCERRGALLDWEPIVRRFQRGDMVEITRGHFAGYTGEIESAGKETARVRNLRYLGKIISWSTRCTVSVHDIEGMRGPIGVVPGVTMGVTLVPKISRPHRNFVDSARMRA